MQATIPLPSFTPLAVPRRQRRGNVWFDTICPLLTGRLFAGRVVVTGREHVPASGPVLFVARHRAGIMDGWMHAYALPRPATFVIAGRLLRAWWLRPLVTGIQVVRRKDGDTARADRNREAFARCRTVLAAGGALVIYPEGTSTLDDAVLKLEPGAAELSRIVPGVRVVPVSVTYREPRRIGGAVAIHFGFPETLVETANADRTAHLRRMLASLPDGSGLSAERDLRSVFDAPVRWLATAIGRHYADDDTAVLPIAALASIPLQLLWSGAVIGTCIATGFGWGALAYAGFLASRLLRRQERPHA